MNRVPAPSLTATIPTLGRLLRPAAAAAGAVLLDLDRALLNGQHSVCTLVIICVSLVVCRSRVRAPHRGTVVAVVDLVPAGAVICDNVMRRAHVEARVTV